MTSPIESTAPPPEESVQVPRERAVPDHKATEGRNARRAKYGLTTKDKEDPSKFMDLGSFGSDDDDRPRETARRYRKGLFVAPLTDIYTTVGMMITPFDAECGMAVITSAQSCAESLDKLAQNNDAVKRALFSIIETSTIGAVIAAHIPIILAIVSHHVPGIKNKMGSIMGKMNEEPKGHPDYRSGPGEEK